MLFGHGGNISEAIEKYKLPENRIIDFSSNINPFGISPKIKKTIIQKISLINRYPDYECKRARESLSDYWRIDKDNFLLGNGSNELIHLIPRALHCSKALIYQPTFSEYEWSLRLSKTKPIFIFSKEKQDFCMDINKIIKKIPKVKLVILCNPNNPTGHLLKKEELFCLIEICQKNKTYLLVDEVFMEFVEAQEKYSLLREASQQKYLLVLRSFTKFYGLAGLRAGYLVANKELIRKMRLFQPTWSVNSLVQEIISPDIFDQKFIKKTKEYIKKERAFLFNNLRLIDGLYPYFPTANFIFCKITYKKIDARYLFLRLIKYGIIIRDCSNFKGLNNRFFRIAVRKRKDNLYFIESIKKILK